MLRHFRPRSQLNVFQIHVSELGGRQLAFVWPVYCERRCFTHSIPAIVPRSRAGALRYATIRWSRTTL